MIWYRLRLTLEMIKFEHSVFALPFALTGALLGLPSERLRYAPGIWRQLLWIVVAMVAARSAAMAFNRLVDADIDARNPRTRMRAIPAGTLSPRFAWGFVVAASRSPVLRRRRTESALPAAGAAGAGDRLLLFVHQAVHHVLPPGARFQPGNRAGRRLDRRPRFARSAHSAGSPPR